MWNVWIACSMYGCVHSNVRALAHVTSPNISIEMNGVLNTFVLFCIHHRFIGSSNLSIQCKYKQNKHTHFLRFFLFLSFEIVDGTHAGTTFIFVNAKWIGKHSKSITESVLWSRVTEGSEERVCHFYFRLILASECEHGLNRERGNGYTPCQIFGNTQKTFL